MFNIYKSSLQLQLCFFPFPCKDDTKQLCKKTTCPPSCLQSIDQQLMLETNGHSYTPSRQARGFPPLKNKMGLNSVTEGEVLIYIPPPTTVINKNISKNRSDP